MTTIRHPPTVTLHCSSLPLAERMAKLKMLSRESTNNNRGQTPPTGDELERRLDDWLATGLAVGSSAWDIFEPAIGGGMGGEGPSSMSGDSASVELSSPVGVAWDKRRRDALHFIAQDFSTVATARLEHVVAAGNEDSSDSEIKFVSSAMSPRLVQHRERTFTPSPCARVEICSMREIMLGASLRPPELHLSSFAPPKRHTPQKTALESASVPLACMPDGIAIKAEGDLALSVGGGLLEVFRTSGGGRGSGRHTACRIEKLEAMHLPSKGKVLRCKFMTGRRGRVAIFLVQAGETRGVTATSMLVECTEYATDNAGDDGEEGSFRLLTRSLTKMVNGPAGAETVAVAAEWDESGREVVLGALGGALSVHPRGRPDSGDAQAAPALRMGRVPGNGTPTLLRWGRVGGDDVLAVAIEGGRIAMLLPSLQPLHLVMAPCQTPRRALVPGISAEPGTRMAGVVPGAEGRILHIPPRVGDGKNANESGDDDDVAMDDDISFIEWQEMDGRLSGAWGRMVVVTVNGCATIVDVSPDAPAALCGEARGALGVASAAKNLPALEELIVGIMRRGPGGCGRVAGDPAAAAAVLNAAAAAAWRIASSGPSSGPVREGTVVLIRRVVQWRAARGDLEGAYSLAHVTGDRATLEDVYCAALRQGNFGMVSVVRDRLAGTEKSSSPHKSLPSIEELSCLASLETHSALRVIRGLS